MPTWLLVTTFWVGRQLHALVAVEYHLRRDADRRPAPLRLGAVRARALPAGRRLHRWHHVGRRAVQNARLAARRRQRPQPAAPELLDGDPPADPVHWLHDDGRAVRLGGCRPLAPRLRRLGAARAPVGAARVGGMGTGLSLGGFWAYEALRWGGFWGWDPVELVAGALAVCQRPTARSGRAVGRGSMKRSNLALAVTGELMVIYSTFLTRSGILGKFLIHSFVELGLMGYLMVFMAVFALLGFGLLLWRWRTIGRRVIYQEVLSREFGLLVSMALFVAVALIVGVGTSMPVISLLPGFPSQASIDLGWYGPNVAPFGLVLLLTMAVGPLLGWQRSKYGSLLRALQWPTILAGVTVFAALLLNVTYPTALIFLAAAVFAVAANVAVIRLIWRAGLLKLGGYLCHIGAGLLFVGIVGTAFYKQSASLQLTEGVPQIMFGRQFTLNGLVLPPDDPLKRSALQIEVMDPERQRTWIAQAPYYIYEKSQQMVMHPAI